MPSWPCWPPGFWPPSAAPCPSWTHKHNRHTLSERNGWVISMTSVQKHFIHGLMHMTSIFQLLCLRLCGGHDLHSLLQLLLLLHGPTGGHVHHLQPHLPHHPPPSETHRCDLGQCRGPASCWWEHWDKGHWEFNLWEKRRVLQWSSY